jgi:hypothetical protein
MADESVHNNPQDLEEERFVRLEMQVVEINHNMNLLIEALEINIEPFGDDGGSKSKIKLEDKYGDNEYPKNESWKEPEKVSPSSSVINPS